MQSYLIAIFYNIIVCFNYNKHDRNIFKNKFGMSIRKCEVTSLLYIAKLDYGITNRVFFSKKLHVYVNNSTLHKLMLLGSR